MTRTRALIAGLVTVFGFYAVVIGVKGFALLGSGEVHAVLLGLAVLALPVVGLFVVWRELEFGRRCAQMAADLESEGGLPEDDLVRLPSGRFDRTAADEEFTRMRAEAEAEPDSWRAWFRLALAYDAAGDRTRARAAARHAIALHG